MNLRSYMRGLGLGIMVCAILLSLSNSKRNKITDAQIKARAAELGMVEENSSVLTSLVDEVKTEDRVKESDEEKPEVIPIEEATVAENTKDSNIIEPKKVEKSDDDSELLDSVDDQKPVSDDKKLDLEEKPKDYPTEGPAVKKMVMVTVYPGEGSYTISKKLANLGLVESADIFDNYLCQNGYDKRLCTGNYNLMIGDSAESIAKRLTGQ